MLQLLSKDEYGGTTIVETSNDYKKLVKKAKESVIDDNMENALTMEEKLRNWTSYWVEVLDESGNVVENAIYAGIVNAVDGQTFYLFKDDGSVEEARYDDLDIKIRFFIGEEVTDKRNNKKVVLHAISGKKKLIDNLEADELEGKVVYFIRKVR